MTDTNKPATDEHELFEASLLARGYHYFDGAVKGPHGAQEWEYYSAGTQHAWQGWQAARAQFAAPRATPRLIGWRTSDYLMETADPAKAKNWEPHHTMMPIFEGDPNTSLTSPTASQAGRDAQRDGLACAALVNMTAEAARRDALNAARYRWLRENCLDWNGDSHEGQWGALHFEDQDGSSPIDAHIPSTLDAAIDAALAGTPGAQGER